MDEKRPSLSLELPDDDDLPQAFPVLPTGSRWAKIELGDFFWIGRTPIANLVVTGDQEISRFHAIVEREGGSYRIMDMRSMNGTTVNGRRVRRQILVPGDVIRVGQSRIRFTPAQADDTIFETGSVRRSGGTSFELRQHWSSIQMMPRPQENPGDPPGYHYRIPQAITGDLAAFEVFLTVAIDRIAAAFRAHRACLYLPPIGENRPLKMARQCHEDGIELVELPDELLQRVNRAFGPSPDDPSDDGASKDPSLILWNGEQLLEDRLLRRGVLTDVSAMSASLPEVRRKAEEARADPVAGWVSWIHLEFDPDARSLARDPALERVFLDVVGGLSAAASRYVSGYEAQ
jgi:hypothetical protein